MARRRLDRRRARCCSPASTARSAASRRTTASARTTGSSAPAMSSTGGALLANDPHLGISMPSIWFINGLHCATVGEACPFDVAGVSFPGVPGVVLGHNARIAWGATNADPDVQDLVIETVDPADPTPLPRPRRHVAPVHDPDRADRGLRRRAGHPRGPRDRPRPDPQRRRRAAGRQPADGAALVGDPSGGRRRTGRYEAILGLNVAADFDDFRAALSLYGAPSQNFVYADVDGHIGYQLPGLRAGPLRPRRPRRSAGPGLDRRRGVARPDPVRGAAVGAGPGRWLDRDRQQRSPSMPAYPHFLGQEWDPGYRAERIIDLINDHGAGRAEPCPR